ncbi:TetR/AcrR family transcriptional regulator [Streptomyces sp. NPDC091376]|uniref:TetR/AcrR family transcriptional regulator n=1 Tax=Streptomyces sp. NPDC091376 TaxID=3365994 RepID=UPI0037FC85CC
MRRQPYHHGDLRKAFMDAAVDAIAENGPGAMSLRELARRTGVSHAAPQHHFGDKAGLLTAVACEGFELLAEALQDAGDELLDVGVAYVDFAVRHRAHFEVMFQPSLYHADAPDVLASRDRVREALEGGLGRLSAKRGESSYAPVAAWSIVHGFATLWLAGALPPDLGDDPEAAARPVIRMLFDRGQ